MSRIRLEKIMKAFLPDTAARNRLHGALLDRKGDSAHAIDGQPIHLWNRAHLNSIRPRPHTVEAAAHRTLDVAARRGTRLIHKDGAVIAHFRFPADGGTDFVAHVSDGALDAVFMRLLSPDQRFDSDGRLRQLSDRDDGLRTARLALRCLVLSCKAEELVGSGDPDPSNIRKASKRISQRLEVQSPEKAGRMMQDDLMRSLAEMAQTHAKRGHAELVAYHERFLAPWSQLRFLPDPSDPMQRIIPVVTMGPNGGKPLVALHAMMLPDLGQREAELFNDYGIQVFFPLRSGVLDTHAAQLSPDEHLADALRGIEAVASSLESETFHLAAMVTSSRIALAYACAHPERVSAVSFLAACVWNGRPDKGARGISKALINGLRDTAFQWRPLSRFMIEEILGSKRFPSFIRSHFEAAGPDRTIIDREIRSWPGAERMRYALRTSLTSIRHDFLLQAELGWENAVDLEIPMIFHHGTADRIHPIALIEELSKALPTSSIHRVPGGGQLLYYEFFAPILKEIASQISNTK